MTFSLTAVVVAGVLAVSPAVLQADAPVGAMAAGAGFSPPAAASPDPPAAASPNPPAAAPPDQTPARPQPAPARGPVRRTPPPPKGFRAFVSFDRTALTASRTFETVLGSSDWASVGGGVEATNLVGRVFARAAFSRGRDTGERVIVIDGAPIALGIPVEVEMAPVEIAGGWRQPFGRRGRVVGYAGAGVLSLQYKESSQFGTPDDDSSERFTGSVFFGGADVDVWKGLMIGAEVQYRSVPDAIGGGEGCATGFTPPCSVADVYRETNLGGTTVRVLIGYRR